MSVCKHRALFQIKMEDVSVRFWREVVRFEIEVDALPTLEPDSALPTEREIFWLWFYFNMEIEFYIILIWVEKMRILFSGENKLFNVCFHRIFCMCYLICLHEKNIFLNSILKYFVFKIKNCFGYVRIDIWSFIY